VLAYKDKIMKFTPSRVLAQHGLLLTFLVGCCPALDSVRKHGSVSCETECSNNLSAVALQLALWVGSGEDYPSNFADLQPTTTDAARFLCPCTGHNVGRGEADAWTDYIYVASLPVVEEDPRIPLLICPPANHRSTTRGYVVWSGREVEWIKAADIERLVRQPWCLATNATVDQLQRLRTQVVVHVPRGLQTRYPDAYRHP
jgi:hypothetical protein